MHGERIQRQQKKQPTFKFRIFLNSYGFIKYVYNGIRDNKDQYVHVAYTHNAITFYRTFANVVSQYEKRDREREKKKLHGKRNPKPIYVDLKHRKEQWQRKTSIKWKNRFKSSSIS